MNSSSFEINQQVFNGKNEMFFHDREMFVAFDRSICEVGRRSRKEIYNVWPLQENYGN